MSDTSLESHPNYPFMLFIWPDENLDLKFIYDNKLYSKEKILEFLEDIKVLIHFWIQNPDASVSDLLSLD